MKLTGFNIFKAGAYITRGGWANAADLCDHFKNEFSKIAPDKSAVIAEIDSLIKNSKPKTKIGQIEARTIVLADDLKKIRENILECEFIPPEKDLQTNFEKLKCLLIDASIKYEQPLFIVDHFPKPYDFFDKNGTSGTQFDAADNKMFGLKQGIYLRRQRLNPVISNFLMAHELIHAVSGLRDPDHLARGLEEGFTQFFGELYLCGQFFGYRSALNYEINRRFEYPAKKQHWEQYTDWLRQGCVFYQKFGLKGIIEIIKKGRGTIKAADELMMQGRLNDLELPAGDWTKELDDAAQTILSFNRNLVYSPLAVYLAKNLEIGENVDDLFFRLNIRRPEGAKALKELNERIFSILTNKNKIAIDDTKLYLRSSNLRYEILKSN